MQRKTKVNEPTTRVIIQLDACGSLLESGSHKVDVLKVAVGNGDTPNREEGQSGIAWLEGAAHINKPTPAGD